MKLKPVALVLASLLGAQVFASKQVAYIYGDVAADGTIPSGAAPAFHQMLLSDTGNQGCSQFKALVEAEGYSIAQYYDQATTLDAAFLAPLDVIVFGLHQKVWPAAERAALDAWIRAGGGIFMYNDSAAGGLFSQVGIKNATGQMAVNSILGTYGMQVAVDQGGGTRSYTSAVNELNTIVSDRPVFEGEGVSPVAVDTNSGARALILLDNAYKIGGSNINPSLDGITIANPVWAVLAQRQVGRGNVIASFDRQAMWNNGGGSNIQQKDNREVLRRIVKFLARDYANAPEWFEQSAQVATNGVDGKRYLELAYRQWSGGHGTVGVDYTVQELAFSVEQTDNLRSNSWVTATNRVQQVGPAVDRADGTETVTVQLLPSIDDAEAGFARMVLRPGIPPPESNVVLAINCGGGSYTSTLGTEYIADAYFVGGHTDTFPGNAVANTSDDLLYNYARSAHSAYAIPLANGAYRVTLQFAETFFSAENKRVFDVGIEGTLVIDDLDLVATTGGKWVAYDRTFEVVVADGTLNLDFSASVNNALLNAILIE